MESWWMDVSPPLLLHAGGGGGAGDMPCLPHLQSNLVRMIVMVKVVMIVNVSVEIELRKSKHLLTLSRCRPFKSTSIAFRKKSVLGSIFLTFFQKPVIIGLD